MYGQFIINTISGVASLPPQQLIFFGRPCATENPTRRAKAKSEQITPNNNVLTSNNR